MGILQKNYFTVSGVYPWHIDNCGKNIFGRSQLPLHSDIFWQLWHWIMRVCIT